MPESPPFAGIVGIDIAAKTFTATWTPHGPPRPRIFEHTTAGYQALVSQLSTVAPTPADVRVAMEATGSYWIAVATFLYEAGYAVVVINPAQIASFAKSLPRRAKTDLRDAELICQFAQERTPPTWTPPPSVYHELRQRLVARDALMEMRQQARNQHHALAQWPIQVAAVTTQFVDLITELDARIAQIERQITQTLHDGAWATSVALLTSIPGLGPTTIAWLLVATVNFTLCPTAESMAAYAGLAPLAHESGTSVRRQAQLSRSGHARLRKALYLATLSAARHNPLIRTFYQRLRAAGKPFKVAQCAAARKLLTLAWAVVTKQQSFDPARGRAA
jgi:transposase